MRKGIVRRVRSDITEVAIPLIIVDSLLVIRADRRREAAGHAEIDAGIDPATARVTGIAAIGADEEIRCPRLARVELDARPGVVVARATNRWATTRFTIGIRRNEVPEVAADMSPPLIGELHVPIRVERHVGRQAGRRPRLERVEVEERATIHLRRRVHLEREPVAEHLLIGARLEPKVIGLEAGREALVDALEAGHAAAGI